MLTSKCRSTDGSVKALILLLNIGHIEEGISVEFRPKYSTNVTEHGSFNEKKHHTLNCLNLSV